MHKQTIHVATLQNERANKVIKSKSHLIKLLSLWCLKQHLFCWSSSSLTASVKNLPLKTRKTTMWTWSWVPAPNTGSLDCFPTSSLQQACTARDQTSRTPVTQAKDLWIERIQVCEEETEEENGDVDIANPKQGLVLHDFGSCFTLRTHLASWLPILFVTHPGLLKSIISSLQSQRLVLAVTWNKGKENLSICTWPYP